MKDLLDLLPEMDEEGWYFELRKQEHWVCAKTNLWTNKEAFNNIGTTAESAVIGMLDRLQVVRTTLSQERIDYMDQQRKKDRQRLGLSGR